MRSPFCDRVVTLTIEVTGADDGDSESRTRARAYSFSPEHVPEVLDEFGRFADRVEELEVEHAGEYDPTGRVRCLDACARAATAIEVILASKRVEDPRGNLHEVHGEEELRKLVEELRR